MDITLIQTTHGQAPWQQQEIPKPQGRPRRVVRIHPDAAHQAFLGLGTDINGCTCANLLDMGPQRRAETLTALFDREKGAGFSLLRDDIGSSDFTFARYSLAEEPGDVEMKSFDFSREERYTIPMIREVRALAPDLRLLGSPWSPPAWMKSTKSMVGPAGKLLRRYYPAYARYLARYVQEMAARGVTVDYLTTQNEARADHGGAHPMAQCVYTAQEERDFLRDHLIPTLREAGLATKIWIFDHNWNMDYYPRTILADPRVAPHVDAVAWHHYGGSPRAMERFAQDFPGVGQQITEGQLAPFRTTLSRRQGTSLARCLRCGAGSYIMWVMVLNEEGGPGEGPFMMRRDPHNFRTFDVALWERREQKVYINETVAIMGQFSRYIQRGARRVDSTPLLDSVAFRNPDGSVVLVVENNVCGGGAVDFAVEMAGQRVETSIPPYTVQTYVFR